MIFLVLSPFPKAGNEVQFWKPSFEDEWGQNFKEALVSESLFGK